MKKFLSLVLALVMTMSLVTVSAGAEDFTDDSSITYDEAVAVMSAVDVIDGYTDGSFQPTTLLTRGAAAKIICNLILGPTTAAALGADTAPYSDVPTTNVFAGYIAYCQKEGIISGYADGTFKPSAPLTGYAFMKMLLGALGYDAAKEGYTGANWSINVAKQAIAIGLEDGNDEFVGQASVNREEAMLYAFNAMNATMVEYGNDTTITVGDVVVSQSGKATEVANTAATETIKNDNKMQFAEKYFSNLKKVATTDAFDRPATNWKVKTVSVGTYVDSADLTYTEEVKLATIYSDLGLSKGLGSTAVEFHVNGATESASGNDNSTSPVALTTLGLVKGAQNKIGGNGVLTEVFYDTDAETVVITLINTYAGEVTGIHTATSSYDAYINVAPAVAGVGTAGTFETDATYAIDDVVLYTYSVKTGEGIQSVVPAEIVTGNVSAYTEYKNITVGGTLYNAAKVYAPSLNGMSNTMGYEVGLVLDQYGYVLKVDTDKASSNYAVVLSHDSNAVDGGRAKLLFTDGTTKVVNLKNTTIAAYADSYTSAAPVLSDNDIVRYVVDGDGKYTLTLVGDAGTTGTSVTPVTKGNAIPAGNTYANYENQISQRDLINRYTGKTIFLVKSNSGSSTVYNVYTGIANVPTITFAGTAGIQAIYAKDLNATNNTRENGAATVVYIDATAAGATVNSSSKDVVFVKGSSVGQSYTADEGFYYVYDAIVNGEITTIKTVTATTVDTLYSTVNYDGKGIATLDNGVKLGTASYSDTINGARYGTGTDVEANGSIGLLGSYYTYADDCKVFYKDTDGNMSVYSISSIAEDTNDKVFVKFVDGEASTIVISQVADGGAGSAESTYAVGTAFTATANTSGITLATGTIVDQDSNPVTISSGLTATAVVKAWTGSAWTTYAIATDSAASISSGSLTTTLTAGLTSATTYQVTVTLSGNEFGTLTLFNNTVTVA